LTKKRQKALETPEIYSADQMRKRYDSFYDQSPKQNLDRRKVPEELWPLLPYAEFWGIADELTRDILVKQAPADVQRNLKDAVATFENALEEWLAGPETDNPNPSDEYIAFAAMIMAADSV